MLQTGSVLLSPVGWPRAQLVTVTTMTSIWMHDKGCRRYMQPISPRKLLPRQPEAAPPRNHAITLHTSITINSWYGTETLLYPHSRPNISTPHRTDHHTTTHLTEQPHKQNMHKYTQTFKHGCMQRLKHECTSHINMCTSTQVYIHGCSLSIMLAYM